MNFFYLIRLSYSVYIVPNNISLSVLAFKAQMYVALTIVLSKTCEDKSTLKSTINVHKHAEFNIITNTQENENLLCSYNQYIGKFYQL